MPTDRTTGCDRSASGLPFLAASSSCACFNRWLSDVSRASSGDLGSCPGSSIAMHLPLICAPTLEKTGRVRAWNMAAIEPAKAPPLYECAAD